MKVNEEVVVTICSGLGYLGEAQFPWAADKVQYVQVRLEDFDASPAMVHELGHYVGLFHTFAGDCSGDQGDWVEDTAVGTDASNNCLTPKDSCPGAAGRDEVKNFMNYGSKWECGMSFSLGQAERARRAMEQYRGGLIQRTRVSTDKSDTSGATQTPACAQAAQTLEDCWCATPQLDPRQWCRAVSPDGRLFVEGATWAPPERDSAAGIVALVPLIALLVLVALL
jgi:hypothetical protein